MDDLGEQLVREMDKESIAHGATFILVTRISELHESFIKTGKLSINIDRALSNMQLRIPNDTHCNEPANGVIAWEIAQFLETRGIVPNQDRHVK